MIVYYVSTISPYSNLHLAVSLRMGHLYDRERGTKKKTVHICISGRQKHQHLHMSGLYRDITS